MINFSYLCKKNIFLNIEINISRIEYLLSLYRLTVAELLDKISDGLKNPISKEEIFTGEVKISHLKRIDKIFNKGIDYYINPQSLKKNKNASIFFRKNNFNSELNIGAKKIVNQFEDLKINLSVISKLSNTKLKRQFRIYTVNDNPKSVAQDIRSVVYPIEFTNNLRDFLKSLISTLASNNIFVFEFIETWNKREKANINGFFLEPNVIVLKRQQKSFRREIFTLIHEFGHYLLNKEEIEEVDVKSISTKDLSKVENWCNEFAYHFLIGQYGNILDKLEPANSYNDYHIDIINDISKNTNLSVLALFTRLLYTKKISKIDYNNVKNEIDENFRLKEEREKEKKELEKQMGIKQRGSVPKPINSPLYVNTLQTALYDGIINEYDFCKQLKIKPEQIEQYI